MLSFKEIFELLYWKFQKARKSSLSNEHYKYFYTKYFSLKESFYTDKVILDVGCGPRGSLEWADMSKSRTGVDPLADKYLKLGASTHKMNYIKAYVEKLPFPDQQFDILTSFNSLDHVEDIKEASKEMKRVLKKGGLMLIIVDIHKLPTFTEPQTFGWDLIESYFGDLELIDMKRLKMLKRNRIYFNLRKMELLNENENGDGVLTAMLKRK